MENREQYVNWFLERAKNDVNKTGNIPFALISIHESNNEIYIFWDSTAHEERMAGYLRQLADNIEAKQKKS